MEKYERNGAIYLARLSGQTFDRIGHEHDISAARARSIYVRECQRRGVLITSSRRRPGQKLGVL